MIRTLALISLQAMLALVTASHAHAWSNPKTASQAREQAEKLARGEEITADASDPFDRGWKLTFGKYKDQRIDSSHTRPAIILKNEGDFVTFANFFHDGRFWTAKIRRDSVEDIHYMMYEWQSGIGNQKVGHAMWRFTLKDGAPVELEAQGNAPGPRRAKVWDIVWSLDYAAPPGIQYDIKQGELGHFSDVANFSSTTSRLSPDDGPAHQHLLKASPSEKAAFLEKAIENSEKRGMGVEMYSTTGLRGTNCVKSAIRLLDDVFNYVFAGRKFRDFMPHVFTSFNDPVVGPSLEALKARGRIDGPADNERVQDELEGLRAREAAAVQDLEKSAAARKLGKLALSCRRSFGLLKAP